jgi:hypothetical protein
MSARSEKVLSDVLETNDSKANQELLEASESKDHEAISELLEAIKSNNLEAIRELVATIGEYDYSTVLRMHPHYIFVHWTPSHGTFGDGIKADTFRLLFELGIFKTNDMLFLEKLLRTVCSYKESKRVYKLFDVFDKESIVSYIKTYSEGDEVIILELLKYGMNNPIWNRDEYIYLINKILAMGVKWDDLSRYDQEDLGFFHYNPKTNTISQSLEQYASELSQFQRERTFLDGDGDRFDKILEFHGFIYNSERRSVEYWRPCC